MRNSYFIILVLGISLFFGVNSAFAQSSIVVTTDKAFYSEGNIILITGEVSQLLGSYGVALTVISPNGNLVSIDMLSVGADKKFGTSLAAGGTLMKNEGTYTVVAQYADNANNVGETTFEFGGSTITPSSSSQVTSSTVSVQGSSDLIGYVITGGKLLRITPDSDANSLIISIDATSDGSLTLTIPRSILDATIYSQDDDFFVLVNGEEVDFDETTTYSDRTLTIAFPSKATEIEILGTYVVSGSTYQEPVCGSGTKLVNGICQVIVNTPKPASVNTTTVKVSSGSGAPGCETSYSCYEPYSISIKTGNTVTWRNVDSAAHTVTSGTPDSGVSGIFDSSLFVAGSSYSYQFNNSGTFHYFCMVHPWMQGEVLVSDSSSTTPTPTSISVWTDKTNYGHNDMIQVKGQVSNVSGFPITITVVNPLNSLVTVDSLSVDNDGSFETTLSTAGAMWKYDGTYTIKVDYGSAEKTNTAKIELTGGVAYSDPGTPTPTTPGTLSISTDDYQYSPSDLVTLKISTSKSANVAISVIGPNGDSIVSRSVTTDFRGSGSLQFKLPESSQNGSYRVDSTATISGSKVSDSTLFTVKSTSVRVSITSLQPTDQQGNTVSSFTKGKLGFAKIVLNTDASVTSLVTINLFDSDLTSLGIGSFKTTLSSGQSEMTLSFFIPNYASFGSGDIYANVFSDWPSQGGVPLTGESAVKVRIQ